MSWGDVRDASAVGGVGVLARRTPRVIVMYVVPGFRGRLFTPWVCRWLFAPGKHTSWTLGVDLSLGASFAGRLAHFGKRGRWTGREALLTARWLDAFPAPRFEGDSALRRVAG